MYCWATRKARRCPQRVQRITTSATSLRRPTMTRTTVQRRTRKATWKSLPMAHKNGSQLTTRIRVLPILRSVWRRFGWTVEEKEVLHFINVRLARRGEAPAQRLTIPLMEKELRLSIPTWSRGRKSRDTLLEEVKQRLMQQSSGNGRAAGKWDQDSGPLRINVPDNINCRTAQAREFLKVRDPLGG